MKFTFFLPAATMPADDPSPVFMYQTRVEVSAEQDQLLREYASLFGHVERTLFADIEKGKDANQLKLSI